MVLAAALQCLLWQRLMVCTGDMSGLHGATYRFPRWCSANGSAQFKGNKVGCFLARLQIFTTRLFAAPPVSSGACLLNILRCRASPAAPVRVWKSLTCEGVAQSCVWWLALHGVGSLLQLPWLLQCSLSQSASRRVVKFGPCTD
jgi:hypothetical protein